VDYQRDLASCPNGFSQYLHSFIHRLFGNCQGRAYFDGRPAKTERSKEKKTPDEALIGNFGRHFRVGFSSPWLYDMKSGNQTFPVHTAYHLMIQFQLCQSSVQSVANGVRFLHQIFFVNHLQTSQCRGTQTGFPAWVLVISPGACKSKTADLPMTAEIGSEPDIPFPQQRMSGTTL
jgi:hypothetical protein